MRSKISRMLLTGLIWWGIGLYLVRPLEAETSSTAFTSWLETVVKKGDTESLHKQIYQLKESEKSLYTLIQKASEIVSRHNGDFNLPVGKKDSESGRVYNLLVSEWNSYQTGNDMGKAPGPKTVKGSISPVADLYAPSLSGKIENADHASYEVPSTERLYHAFTASHTLQPLSGGTAIGAP